MQQTCRRDNEKTLAAIQTALEQSLIIDELDRLVTRRYKPGQINEACDALTDGKVLGRAVLEY